ncbi:MAG: ribonuclease R [Deltaproteobacteria bacterium]|nr:ribonuclease R [Deltaproteobacteria bacterium]
MSMKTIRSEKTMIGDISLHYEGYGFVTSGKPKEPDVFVPARLIGDALHGDRVEAAVRKGQKGLLEGSIVRVLERRLKQMIGRLEPQGKGWVVVSEDQRVRHTLRLTKPPLGVKAGDYVVAKIIQYPSGKTGMTGEVIEKLPKRGTLASEAEYVIAKHQLPKKFPKEVEEEADKCGTMDHGPRTMDRKDLRNLSFVTIDGEDAKDFDDAVYAEKLPKDHIRVWVAIADVSHYVLPNSALDREAYARATSVYFPGRVLPMLPEVLSNDLCSLKPNEDRLALVAEFELDKEGLCLNETFYPAVFQSAARLTYTIVRRLLVDKEPELRRERQALLPMLEILSEAATRLKAVKAARGSLDFDLPEPGIILDVTGGVEDIERAERNWSHMIIEELMIAANEAVARFLTAKKVGCIYRGHESPNPDKIRNFYKTVQRLGFKGRFPHPVTNQALVHILDHFKNHPESRLVNTMLLRSMAQAVYSPDNIGHFGLASDSYCHFTSPIRRYPDLMVHRLLKQVLGQRTMDHGPRTKGISKNYLEEVAEHSSKMERRAMEAEREMVALHKALFMQSRVGEVYEGIISHVTKFGFFVELLEYFVEGLVSMQSLSGDYYVFDEAHLCLKGRKHNKIFKMGQKIKIEVFEVKLPERRIFFNPLDTVKEPNI